MEPSVLLGRLEAGLIIFFLITHVWKMCQKCKCNSYCAWFSDQKESLEGLIWDRPNTNSLLCDWHGCFLTSKWTSDVSMYCFSSLFQNFLSFSGIFYGSSPLWESAIKVCDVTSRLLDVSVTQAHVPCTTPPLSLAGSPMLPSQGTFPGSRGRPRPQPALLSFCPLCLR